MSAHAVLLDGPSTLDHELLVTVDVAPCKGASLGTDGAGSAMNQLARLGMGRDAEKAQNKKLEV